MNKRKIALIFFGILLIFAIWITLSFFRTPERVPMFIFKYVNTAQFFQDAKLFLILLGFSFSVVVLGMLFQSYLLLGPISILVFRTYNQPRRRFSMKLKRIRANLNSRLSQWGRVEGLIPQGSSLRYRFYLPNSESLDASDRTWQDTVMKALQTVKLVIVEITNLTENVLWEIETSLKYVLPEQIILIDCRDSEDQAINIEQDLVIFRTNSFSYSHIPEFLSAICNHVNQILGRAPRKRVLIFWIGLYSMTIGVLLFLTSLIAIVVFWFINLKS